MRETGEIFKCIYVSLYRWVKKYVKHKKRNINTIDNCFIC